MIVENGAQMVIEILVIDGPCASPGVGRKRRSRRCAAALSRDYKHAVSG